MGWLLLGGLFLVMTGLWEVAQTVFRSERPPEPLDAREGLAVLEWVLLALLALVLGVGYFLAVLRGGRLRVLQDQQAAWQVKLRRMGAGPMRPSVELESLPKPQDPGP